jgi:CheY-like chemotaxis protein
MGGRIEVDSAYGQGSTFTASLPLVDAEPSIDDREPDEDVGLAGLRLLVVDDHAVNRLVAEKLLGGLGADVVTADSGEEALLGLAPDRYDVILLDVQMPGMSGPETCVAMRAAGVRVPIVALTAGGDARQRAVCLEAGMDEVLTKPLNGATLARHLQALLLAPTA